MEADSLTLSARKFPPLITQRSNGTLCGMVGSYVGRPTAGARGGQGANLGGVGRGGAVQAATPSAPSARPLRRATTQPITAPASSTSAAIRKAAPGSGNSAPLPTEAE